MNKLFKILLCTLVLVSTCYATPPSCLELHQSQLNSLNERMNQMLGALYSSPILSKLQSVTKTEPNSSTTTQPKNPGPVYETSYYPPSAKPTPQVVYVANQYPATPAVSVPLGVPTLSATRTPRSYYSHDFPPLDYNYPTPWSQYYDPHQSTLMSSHPPPVQPLTNSYDLYREPEYLGIRPQTYSAPYITPPPSYYIPPPYHTPPPTYHTPPPAYHAPPATYHNPPTYHTPPPVYSPSPSIAYSPHYAQIAEYPQFYV